MNVSEAVSANGSKPGSAMHVDPVRIIRLQKPSIVGQDAFVNDEQPWSRNSDHRPIEIRTRSAGRNACWIRIAGEFFEVVVLMLRRSPTGEAKLGSHLEV